MSTSFFVTSASESFFMNIWHWLDNTIFHAKTISAGDVNLDKPDLSGTDGCKFSLVDILAEFILQL